MQILLANAKIMFSQSLVQPQTEPRFQAVADGLAQEMAQCDVDELMRQLSCSRPIAATSLARYRNFFLANKIPAIMAYNGQAYKHLHAETLSEDTLRWGQDHLWITCFLYGLLRPMDGIVPYRMERDVHLQVTNDIPLHQFWKDLLTDVLIASVKSDDGILVHLSTTEYEQLFHWKRIRQEVTVIQPLFYVRKGDDLKMQAVWAKTCRGAMTRFILENKIRKTEELQSFCYKGFHFSPQIGEAAFPHFIKETSC